MFSPFMLLIVVAAVLGVWFLLSLVKGILGLPGGLGEPPAIGPRRRGGVQVGPAPKNGRGIAGAPVGARLCPYELCKAPNDGSAHFCRRCGRELAPAQEMRRVG
ncbi:MAG: hypothetical protein ACAI43_18990 [Phycisphaerae bacterium]|nr:hypothetical protein [Tepidisphaeraceae bacterium]